MGRRSRAALQALAAAGLLGAPAAGLAAGEQDVLARVPDSAAVEDRQFEQNYLLGDWGGVRSALWDQGVQVKLLLISDPYGNPMGGKARAFTGYSMFSADLKVDTGKVLDLAGGEFHVGFSTNFGTPLSQDVVGNTFPIQSSDVAPPGPRLTTLSYSQSMLQDSLNLRIGRLSIDSL